jgi:hypothetical protein
MSLFSFGEVKKEIRRGVIAAGELRATTHTHTTGALINTNDR